MPTFRITAPDGTKLKITGAEMPSEAELDNIFRSVGKPVSASQTPPAQEEPKSNWERFKSRLPDLTGITQVPAAIRDLSQQPAGIVDKAISGAIGSLVDPVPQYKALRERGQSPVYSALGSIPLIGPAADVVAQDIYNLRVPEMAGDAVSMAPALLGLKSVQNSKLMQAPVSEIASGVGSAAKTAAKAVANPPAIVGAVTLGVTGDIRTAMTMAGATAAIEALRNPSLADAMAVMPGKMGTAGRLLKRVISKNPEAVSEVLKKAEKVPELASVPASQLPAEASIPSGVIQPSPMSGTYSGRASVASGSSRPASYQRPPVVLDPQYDWTMGPDGVTLPKSRNPDLQGTPVIAAAQPPEAPPAPVQTPPAPASVQAKPAAEPAKASAPGQTARDWIQKYSAADAEGRRALVKGLGGKMTYEDMRQLAAYTDDLTGEASKAPALAEDRFRPVKLDHLKDSAPVVDIPAIAKKLESTPSFDPIMTPEGKGPAQIMGKIQDHPAYKELVGKIKGKSAEEAVQILADAELKDWLIRPTMELAGLEAPTPKMVRAAVERVKDGKYDAWQASERAAAEGDVVTRPHPGQASPAFVNDRLKYLQEQAAKRGDAPAKFAEQVAQNKTKGAELAAALEQPEPRYISESQYRDSLRKTYHAKEGLQSSREVPQTAEIPPVGTRLLDDSVGPDGREFSELVEIPVSKVTISEDTGASKFRDVRRYAEWTLEGKEAPPIRVVQTDKGTLKTLDHRRLLAAKAAGKDTIKAWVNRATKSDRNGLVTGMTKELEAKGAEPLPIVDPPEGMTIYADDAKRLRDLQSELAPQPTARQQGEALHAKAKARAKAAENKTKGAELAAALEQPKTLHSGPRLGESDLDPATVAGIDANAQMLLKDIDASLQSRRGYKEGSHKIRPGDELDLVERMKRSPIKASDLESVLGYGRKDLEGHAKGIVHSAGKPLDTFIEEYLIPEGYVTDVADFGDKLGRALAGEKIFPNGANTGTGTAKAKVSEIAQLVGESPAKIRDALIRDKSNPVELKARRVLNRHDPYDAVAQAEEAYSRMNPDAEPPAGLVNDAPGFPWEKPTARQQGEALHAKAKARGKGKESSGTVGFPTIVKAMSDAVESSLQAGRNKISNVKVKLSPDGSHEVFTFDLDGVPHSAPLKGKTAQALYRQGYLPGNVELDTKIANGLVLDKVAKSVRSKE